MLATARPARSRRRPGRLPRRRTCRGTCRRIRAQCETLTDAELACVTKDQPIATDCLPQAKLDALRAAVLPLLELPAELRVAAEAAERCEYQTAMDLMNECANVPDHVRKLLVRAWASTVNVRSPPFWCKVGVEVMKMRLAAIGC